MRGNCLPEKHEKDDAGYLKIRERDESCFDSTFDTVSGHGARSRFRVFYQARYAGTFTKGTVGFCVRRDGGGIGLVADYSCH